PRPAPHLLSLHDALPISASCEPRHEWYLGCYFAAETERGLSDREDRLFAALFRAKLEVGSSATLVLSTDEAASLDGETARAERADRKSTRLNSSHDQSSY